MKTIAEEISDHYRRMLNPLRGLSMRRVVSYLEDGQRGAFSDLQWLFWFTERRDATLRGAKRRLRSALRKLDWAIKVRDDLEGAAAKLAERQQERLRAAYERVGNLRQALASLALAEFRGFAHLEKHWVRENGIWNIERLEPVPQWHWVRDGLYGAWQFSKDAASGRTKGDDINADNFIIRSVEDPIDEIAVICFLRKNLSQKDWDAFVEMYGLPFYFIIMPDLTDEKKKVEFLKVAEKMTGDSRGVLPSGSDIKSADAGIRGVNPFRSHLDYQDEQIVMAATAGKLTMLSGPTGIGQGASDAHEDTFADIAQDQAGEISEVLQEQFDAQILNEAFPGEPHYVYFELAAKPPSDVTAEFAIAESATRGGYRIPAAQLAEKTGYDVQDAPVPAASPSLGVAFNRAPPSAKTTGGDALDAFLQKLVMEGDSLTPEEIQGRLSHELPQVYAQLERGGRTAADILQKLSIAAVQT